MTIMMNEFGRSLTTRMAGRAAYDRIAPALLSSTETVTFDFSGVSTVTNSFADEVFGRLVAELGFEAFKSKSAFRNVGSLWAKVIRSAMDSRALQTA